MCERFYCGSHFVDKMQYEQFDRARKMFLFCKVNVKGGILTVMGVQMLLAPECMSGYSGCLECREMLRNERRGNSGAMRTSFYLLQIGQVLHSPLFFRRFGPSFFKRHFVDFRFVS
jgi:hypothetical protein